MQDVLARSACNAEKFKEKEGRIMRTFRNAAILVPVMLMMLLIPGAMVAQKTTASLFGTVQDGSGAVIPQATITITNTDTGVSLSTTSGGDGLYRFELVPIGNYSMTVTEQGFNKFVQKSISLSVNQEQRLDATLKAGNVEETVTVNSEPAQLNLESATIQKTLESHEVENLPIPDRNLYNLLSLIPGVQNNCLGSTGCTSSLGFNQQVLQMNGGTTADNTGTVSYYLDGGLNMTFVRMTGNDMPSPEAIAEFNVLTSNYDATYGRMSSGVVTAITKSGTNQFHGSAYEYNRNTDFNASNPIIQGGGTPILHRNMFGATVGGPIKRNKTFFFSEYSGLRQVSPYIFSGGAQLPGFTGGMTGGGPATGDFSAFLPANALATAKCGGTATAFVVCNPLTGKPYTSDGVHASNIIPQGQIDPTALAIMNYLKGFENSTTTVVNSSTNQSISVPVFIGQEPQQRNSDEFLLKGEHQINDAQRLTLSYFYIKGHVQTQAATNSTVPWVMQIQDWTQHSANMSHTWTINNAMVNQVYGNFLRLVGSRANSINMGKNQRTSLSSLGSNQLVQGPASLSQIAVSGYFTLGNSIDGPEAGTDLYAVRDLFAYNKGSHSVTFGGEVSLNKDTQLTDLNNYGVFNFASTSTARTGNALSDFVAGYANSQTQDAPVDALDNSWFYALFAQDNWRVRPNLTINLGVRWDVQTAPTDPQNKESTFVPGQQSTVNPNMPLGLLVVGDKGVGRGTVPTSFNHFSPRIGLAWDPFGKGKTSVRASGGIFWGGISGNEWNASSNYYPFSLRYTFPSPGTLTSPYKNSPSPFPYTYTPGSVAPIVNGGSVEGAVPGFVWPSTYQLTASIQQQITNAMALSVAYVGSLARHLPISMDLNYPVFNFTTPTANTTASVNSRRPYYNQTSKNSAGQLTQQLAQIWGVSSNQTSNYNALQATIQQRMTKNVTFNGFYTWSKNIDSNVLNSATPSSTSSAVDYVTPGAEKGHSDFDQRHVFSMSVVWVPNYFHDSNPVVRNVLNGWHVSGIVNLHTGNPFNITTGSDNNQDGDTVDRPSLMPGANPMSTQNRSSRSALAAQYFNPSLWTASATPAPAGTQFCGYSTSNPTGCQGVGPGGSNGSLQRMNYYSPGFRNVNASLFRDFAIWETMVLQARAEASNVFNLVNLGAPGTNLSSATAGKITTQSTGANMRQIQLGLRLSF
jgi:hypothetical protein